MLARKWSAAATFRYVVKPWLTTGMPRSAAIAAILMASVNPPQRVRSTWMMSTWPTSMSWRNDFRSLSSSPAAIRSGLAAASFA